MCFPLASVERQNQQNAESGEVKKAPRGAQFKKKDNGGKTQATVNSGEFLFGRQAGGILKPFHTSRTWTTIQRQIFICETEPVTMNTAGHHPRPLGDEILVYDADDSHHTTRRAYWAKESVSDGLAHQVHWQKNFVPLIHYVHHTISVSPSASPTDSFPLTRYRSPHRPPRRSSG